jgi:hypothetical protein
VSILFIAKTTSSTHTYQHTLLLLQVDRAYFQEQRIRTVDALKQQDAALVITRFVSRIARQNEYSKEKQRALRIQKLLQLNLSQAQVCITID